MGGASKWTFRNSDKSSIRKVTSLLSLQRALAAGYTEANPVDGHGWRTLTDIIADIEAEG